MFIRYKDSSVWVVFALMGGFALVNDNKVTILVNEAELGSVFQNILIFKVEILMIFLFFIFCYIFCYFYIFYERLSCIIDKIKNYLQF